MNRTTAIILTVVSAVICGCPGLALVGTALLGALGSQTPDFAAQNPPGSAENALLGSGMFLCVGGILILIPIIVGFLSLRYAKPETPVVNDYVPPAS